MEFAYEFVVNSLDLIKNQFTDLNQNLKKKL